jgi:ER lumen protein retaining receptor
MIGSLNTMIGSLNGGKISDSPSEINIKVAAAYMIFLAAAILVYRMIAEGEFSSVLTLSALFQCLAFSLLGIQVFTSGVKGVSAKSLQLDAMALACRLSSTLWLNGYLPDDVTGDMLYQVIDVVSLVLVLVLLHYILNVNKASYNADDDELKAWPFAAGALFFAIIFHGDLNDRPIFDALWMCGLNISAVSVLPQLWMMTHNNTTVQALTSHFVAVMAMSRVLSGSYMWHAHTEITCEPWFFGTEDTCFVTGYAILVAHAVHLLLLADFAYYYVKTLTKSGLTAPLDLPGSWMV